MQMITSKSLIFPVIAYKENEQGLYVFLNREALTRTSVRLCKEKVYDGVLFIDSEGSLFKCVSIDKTGWGNSFMGYSLMYKGRLVKVEFSLIKLGLCDLKEFKDFILTSGKHYSSNFSEVEDAVKVASTYEKVIKLMQ